MLILTDKAKENGNKNTVTHNHMKNHSSWINICAWRVIFFIYPLVSSSESSLELSGVGIFRTLIIIGLVSGNIHPRTSSVGASAPRSMFGIWGEDKSVQNKWKD